MTDVEKSEILHIWHVFDDKNVATYGKFVLFCCKISFVIIYTFCSEICFVTIYALLCGDKLSQNFSVWRKNDKYEVWWWPYLWSSIPSDGPRPHTSEYQALISNTLHLRHVVFLLVLFLLLPSSLQSKNWQDAASDLICRDNSTQIREKTRIILEELKTQFGGPGW